MFSNAGILSDFVETSISWLNAMTRHCRLVYFTHPSAFNFTFLHGNGHIVDLVQLEFICNQLIKFEGPGTRKIDQSWDIDVCGMSRKTGNKVTMAHHITVIVLDPGSSIQQHTFKKGREITAANVTLAPEALGAFSTWNHPGYTDMIPFLNLCNAGTDSLDNTGTLVSRDQGQRYRNLAQF
jgi:hypothetical protein